MLVDNVTTSYPEPFIKIREDKRRDWSEIAIYVEAKIGQITAAIITHPCAGANWFVHSSDTYAKAKAFKTRKSALEFALLSAKETEAYKRHAVNVGQNLPETYRLAVH